MTCQILSNGKFCPGLSLAVPWVVGFGVLSSPLPGLSSWKAETVVVVVVGFCPHHPFAFAACAKLSVKGMENVIPVYSHLHVLCLPRPEFLAL